MQHLRNNVFEVHTEVVLALKKLLLENKTKSHSYANFCNACAWFLWLCIFLTESVSSIFDHSSQSDESVYSGKPSLINTRCRSKDLEWDLFCFNETFFKKQILSETVIKICEPEVSCNLPWSATDGFSRLHINWIYGTWVLKIPQHFHFELLETLRQSFLLEN